MTPLGALYRGRNWVGAIPPKIWEKRPAVGSPSHRRMWGTKRCLEHLMRRCGLRSARTVTGHMKWRFHVWKSKKRVKLVCLSQNPISLLKKKKKSFEGLLWGTRIQIRYLCHVSYSWSMSPLSCRGGHTLGQWGHVNGILPREVLLLRKSFEERVIPDMTEGMVAAPTFNASHLISWLHLCEENLWAILSWPPQLIKGLERCLMGQALKWWTGRSTNGGPRSPEGSYIRWETFQGEGAENQ